MLESLTVRGFKSIRKLESFDLRSLNVLIGANGAGKSNLISLFDMLAAMMSRRLQVFVARHGGPDALLYGGGEQAQNLEVDLRFGNNGYDFVLGRAPGDQLFFLDEATRFFGEWSSPRQSLGNGHYESLVWDAFDEDTMAWYVHRAVRRWQVYHFHDTSRESSMRNGQSVRDNLRLRPDAGNLAPFLRRLYERFPDDYRQILRTIRLAAPFLDDFVYRRYPGERMELEWYGGGDNRTPRGPIQLSDGTLRFICLTTLLLQPSELQPDVIVVDEPELGLHPFAISLLADMLRQVSKDKQVIVSTQSSGLLKEIDPEDVVVVRQLKGESVFERKDPALLREWLEEYTLGELWEMNVIGGGLPEW